MGLLYNFYCALVGFFAFAAIYHSILLSASHRKALLAVFSIECALLATLTGVLVTIISGQKPELIETALWARISIGALMSVGWLWSMSLISGMRARWFVWPVTAVILFIFVVNTFITPLNSRVISLDQMTTPWGEVVTNPRLGPAGWWLAPICVVAMANYLFGLACGVRVWRRERVIGTLILLVGGGFILNLMVEALRVAHKLNYPAYLGVVIQVVWVFVIAVLIARDHRRIRDDLAVSEHRFRAVFDQTFQLMKLVGMDGNVIAANRNALEFAGIREEDIIGKPLWETPWWSHSPETRDRLRQAVDDAAGGRVVRFEATHVDHNGKLAYIDFSLKPIMGERGEFSHLIAEGRDITDRRQAEVELQKSEASYRLLFEGACDAIFLADGETGILIDCNLAAEELLGRKRAEIIGQPQSFLHPPDEATRYRELFQTYARTGRKSHLEVEVVKKDGEKAVVSIAPSVMILGKQKIIQGIFRDVTERKRIDEALQASRQRLEVLSRQLITTQETERRHLARELHDEIGQVLTAIKINLRRTQRVADAGVISQLEENVAMVEQAIVQVRNLALSLRPAQLDELGLAAALHWLLKQQADLGGFDEQLEVNLGDVEIPVELQTVCFRIAQEALTNAVRHGQPNKVEINLWANADQVCLSIHDDGIGFDVSEVRRRALNGSSFGLTSIQERASLVGGQAKIESTPGLGTTIHACCPLSQVKV